MTRRQFEHVIRAAGAIAGVDSLVVIGSQAILGTFPDAPAELFTSMEVDLYPPDDPRLADVIDGSIGEGSPFHEEFGYYAHGVGPDSATLPARWKERAVAISNDNTRRVRAVCLHPADIAVSKLLAGRPRDKEFVESLLARGIVLMTQLLQAGRELPPESFEALKELLSEIKTVGPRAQSD